MTYTAEELNGMSDYLDALTAKEREETSALLYARIPGGRILHLVKGVDNEYLSLCGNEPSSGFRHRSSTRERGRRICPTCKQAADNYEGGLP